MASIHHQTSLQELASRILGEFSYRLDQYQSNIQHQLTDAVTLMQQTSGKLIFCGLGKTGYLANYAHAICTSLGIDSRFLHAAEALHGDMGMIQPNDLMIYISFSGKGSEHIYLAGHTNNSSILLSGNGDSPLGELVDVNISMNMCKADESLPLHAVPTHSNTLLMLTLNTLIMMLVHQQGIDSEQFARNHPGGQIGLEMNLTISQIMRPKGTIPQTAADTKLYDVIAPMTQGCCGLITVINQAGQLQGIFTDGDLRRALQLPEQLSKPIADFIQPKFQACSSDDLAYDVLNKMNRHQITSYIVQDSQGEWVGLVHIHDLLRILKCSD